MKTSFTPLSCNANCNSQNGTVGNYTMNLLATMWIATQCLEDNPGEGIGPVPGTNLFTIHGLWPGNNASSWPSCCNISYSYNASEITDVVDLETNWVSTEGSDDKFYAHEWEKHGTCCLDIFPSEYIFFQEVVNLNKRLNLAGILASAGITPGSTLYSKTAVLEALTNSLGYEPLLECSTVDGQKMLSTVYVCLDHSAELNVQNCTSDYYSKYANKCGSSFYLPEIPSSCYK